MKAKQDAAAQQTDCAAPGRIQDGRLVALCLADQAIIPTCGQPPLWTAEIRMPDDTLLTFSAGALSTGAYHVQELPPREGDPAVHGRWQVRDAKADVPLLTVTANVDIVGARALFHAETNVLAPHCQLERFTYPRLALAPLEGDGREDALLTPSANGQVIERIRSAPRQPIGRGRDVLSALARVRYPSKNGNLQMVYYFCGTGGLLWMTPDPQRRIKDFVVDRGADSGIDGACRHYPTPEEGAGTFRLPYPVQLEWVGGDWFDAAQVYRRWALTQDWATCPGPLGTRTDLPDWFPALPSWVRIPADPLVPDTEKNAWPLEWVKAVGGPMGLHWYGWNASGGFDRCYPEMGPPQDGYAEQVQNYQAAGLRVMPYLNARLIRQHHPIWATYEADAVRERDGALAAPEHWGSYATPAEATAAAQDGRKVRKKRTGRGEIDHVVNAFAVGWPGTPHWRATISEMVAAPFCDYNVDAVYQDQVGVWPLLNYDPGQPDPPGDPLAWQRYERLLYERVLDKLHRQGRQPVLIAEYLNEALLPFFHGSLTVSEQEGAGRYPVPLFASIYHTHYATIGWEDSPQLLQDPPVYLRPRLMPLVFGSQLGWISYVLPELVAQHPHLVACYRQAVALRRRFGAMLGWGRMLRPPRLPDVAQVAARGVAVREEGTGGASEEHTGRLCPAILAGCFLEGETGSRALAVFANWTARPQQATAALDLSPLLGPLRATFVDGPAAGHTRGNQMTLPLHLAPFSLAAVLFETEQKAD